MAPVVFISYRRSDAPVAAELIHERLAKALGHGRVFFDIDSLAAGVDWPRALEQHLDRSTVMVVVIGRNWLDAKDEKGRLRLVDPEDRVSQEVRGAIERGLDIIPVLVEGARMPRSSELPESLRALTRKQSIEVRPSSSRKDLEKLVRRLQGVRLGKLVVVFSAIAMAGAAIYVTPELNDWLKKFGLPPRGGGVPKSESAMQWKTPEDRCDALAGLSTDSQRNPLIRAPSNEKFRSSSFSAIEACEQAVQSSREVDRFQFQLARSYLAARRCPEALTRIMHQGEVRCT